MLFSGIPFIYWFLPAVIILYFSVPKFLKNSVLLISSLAFYGWGEPKYVFLMLGTVLAGYFSGILTEKFRKGRSGKLFLALSVLLSLSPLIYFKYADFFIVNFNRATGLSVPLLKLALPVGISFYTFQILSYTIDVYRGKVSAQKNPVLLATYVAMFPQLIAGPIVRYSDVCSQLESRTHSIEKVSAGSRRFIVGLSKKVLIANTLGELCNGFAASTQPSVLYHWIFAVAYALQIYFDFSGYSDMAIGLGKIFGFDFCENFNYPFISGSITEFWRRWHMSLGAWFRDYVYIPLGGNRVNKIRFLFNIFAVWLLTGFWHGAEWNFIVWGIYFGIFLILEKFFFGKFLEKHKIISHIYLMLLIIISFVIFSAESLISAFTNVGGLFGMGEIPLVSAEAVYALKSFGTVLLIALTGATPLPLVLKRKLDAKIPLLADIIEIVGCVVLILVSTGFLVDGSFNPFLYFRF